MTLKIPFNRFVTFIKPYINVAGASIAAWLVAKTNVLGIPGLGEHEHEIATGIAAGGVALITWAAAQIGDLRWLKGHHIEMSAAAASAGVALPPDMHHAGEEGAFAPAAVVAPFVPATADVAHFPPPAEAHQTGEEGVFDPTVEDLAHTALPSDAEEFASPPPAGGTKVVQPSQTDYLAY